MRHRVFVTIGQTHTRRPASYKTLHTVDPDNSERTSCKMPIPETGPQTGKIVHYGEWAKNTKTDGYLRGVPINRCKRCFKPSEEADQ